jgi:eukaryotic-like serine/threonine-protein kinase
MRAPEEPYQMPLTVGTRLGPYEILGALGAGGMGEVYKAVDTRLDRTVAIKVLPLEVSNDPDLRSRFEREARAIAALDHPNICGLHDVGEQDGTNYLVMQHLEGETLAARLARSEGRALPMSDVLKIAIEIADALDKAHRAGITHRDVKPANIFLVRRGGVSAPPQAKLLDFGLAKLRCPAASISGMTQLATASPNTAKGMILGTVHYMAPEQVEGREADARSDIWALGVVIYEMATGRRPFDGDSPATIIGAILKDCPSPVSKTTSALDHVVSACLEKEADRRWQSATDVHLELEWIRQNSPSLSMVAGATKTPLSILWPAVAVVATIAVIAVAAGVRRPSGIADTIRLQVPPPPGTTFITVTASIPAIQLALAPDGRKLVFVAVEPGRAPTLWMRSLNDDVSLSVPGTDDASFPFWSPDSRSLAFFAHGRLRRVDPGMGEPRDIADALEPRGGTWLRDNTIVFSSAQGGLWRVAAGGGTPERAGPEVAAGGDRWPRALSDGRRVLYVARRPLQSDRGVYSSSMDGGAPTRVLAASTPVAYASPGYLLFVQGRTLLAQRFDSQSSKFSGEATAIAARVGVNSLFYGSFDASDNGVLAYGPPLSSQSQLTWYTRDGQRQETAAPRNDYIDFDLSPDGQRLLSTRIDTQTGSGDVWLMDLRRGTDSRLTSEVITAPGGVSGAAAWAADGSQLAFRSNRAGLAYMYTKAPSGAAADELLVSGTAVNPTSWSADNRIVFHDTGLRTGWDIWQVNLNDRQRVPLIQTAFNEMQGQLSTDGRWLAYASDESGRWEVYVQPVPTNGAKWQISTNGGFEPRWRRDGRELFFLTLGHEVMSAAVTMRPAFEADVPRRLFVAPMEGAVPSGYHRYYAISPDGSRILINEKQTDGDRGAITVVLNWTEMLTK